MKVLIAYDGANDIISADIVNYSISLQSMPKSSNDSSGSVGEFSVEFILPLNASNHLNSRGFEILEGKGVQFESDYGLIYGTINSASLTDRHALTIQCTSYAGGLNAYNVQAKPLYTSLYGALVYYFSLGTESVNVVVDPSIADRTVVYPGWSGELWYHLKLLCAAEDLNFVLTGQGYVYVQPNKTNEVPTSYGTSLSQSVDSSNLAQKVSVREYNCQPVAQALFYPRGGWSEDTEILSVNAGEYTEQVIELGGSIETLQEPQMYEFVERSWDSSSTYTIVAEDGFPVPEALWTSRGGKISFEINDDYQSITVKMRGANGVPLASGDTATSFSLALAADSGGSSRYSTLRIVGSGVLHDHDKELVVNTGIPESVTGTEIGATIDNPFLFNRERVGRAAALAVREYSGAVLSAQGAATNLGSGFTVDDVGARITVGQRPFRVRSVGYAPEGLNFTAEDDLSHEDMQDALSGMTYGEIETENSGLTYRNVFSRGVRYNGA